MKLSFCLLLITVSFRLVFTSRSGYGFTQESLNTPHSMLEVFFRHGFRCQGICVYLSLLASSYKWLKDLVKKVILAQCSKIKTRLNPLREP
jgi:hypothetical protein